MKKVFLTIGLILGIALIWYLFIKPQDYRINAKTNSRKGTINQTLKLWNGTLEGQLEEIQQKNLGQLSQKIQFSDSTHHYNWQIVPVTDSSANIKVDITDLNHSLMNKLKIPFSDTDFEKRSRRTVMVFLEKLREHEESFKITISGEEELESMYCACVGLQSTQLQKASKMMENSPFLNSVLSKNGIELNGVPLIEITDWDVQNDNISYNFCYPIVQNDSLPVIKNIKYKTFLGKKALKATYNGNYISSDRAWYALLDYAEHNNIAIDKTPIEFFFNNPNMGGDELSWKAEIFMPIK